MKLHVYEIAIEATAQELSASNTLAGNLSRLLTRAFAPMENPFDDPAECEEEGVEEE